MKPHSNIQACARLLCCDSRCFHLSLQILLPALSALGRISKSSLSHWLLVGVVQWGAPASDRREGETMSSVVISLVPSLQSCSGLAVPLDGIPWLFPGCMSILFFPLYSPDCPLSLLFQSLGGPMLQLLVIFLYSSHTSLNCSTLTVLCPAGRTLIDQPPGRHGWKMQSQHRCDLPRSASMSLSHRPSLQSPKMVPSLGPFSVHQPVLTNINTLLLIPSLSSTPTNFFYHEQFLSDGLII